MNAITELSTTLAALPAPGTPFEGGHFDGIYVHNGLLKAQISALKSDGGHHPRIVWNKDYSIVEDAIDMVDGARNTAAMAKAGSELAQWALNLRIGGHADWHIPAFHQLERIYRTYKPTEDRNWCSFRDGENYSSLPPTGIYTRDVPAQTSIDGFRAGDANAFEPIGYWSSTQPADNRGCAYVQDFADGFQGWLRKGGEFAAVAVRSIVLCEFSYLPRA